MRGAEHATLALDVREHGLASVGDVLAEDADALVVGHLFVERAFDRLAERDDLAVGVIGGRRRPGRRRDAGERHDVVGDRRRIGPAGGERLLGRLRHMRGRLGLDRLDLLRGDEPPSDELARHPSDRVRLVSSASSSVDRYFAWVSAPECEYGRVTVAWIRAGPTPARTWLMIDAGPLAHLEVVGAVEPMDVEPTEAADQLGDRRRRLVARRHRDRVAVVGDDEQDRQVERARGVEALPELALGRRAFAEGDVGDLVAVRSAAREVRTAGDVARRLRASDGRQALSAGRARLRHDVVFDACPSATASGGRPTTGRLPSRPPAAGSR